MVVWFPEGVTEAKFGMITSAEEVSALTTVTGPAKFAEIAFCNCVAGSAAWKKIAACSANVRSYVMTAVASPLLLMLTERVFAVNALTGITAHMETQIRHAASR